MKRLFCFLLVFLMLTASLSLTGCLFGEAGTALYTEEIVIPATYQGKAVTQILPSAFSGAANPTKITIPDSVTSIGSYAFEDCTGLKSIKYRGTKAQWNAISKGSYWNSGTRNYTITYNYTGT